MTLYMEIGKHLLIEWKEFNVNAAVGLVNGRGVPIHLNQS